VDIKSTILSMIYDDASPHDALALLCHHIESSTRSQAVTIITTDSAGLVHVLAAPSVRAPYRAALEGLPIGPNSGSCGSALYTNRSVEVRDIAHNPRWLFYKTLALPLNYRACSSFPIRDAGGRAVGALAVYFDETRTLSDDERVVVDTVIALAETVFQNMLPGAAFEPFGKVDDLTGLPTRQAFEDFRVQLRCELPGSWAMVFLEVDNIKATNAEFGLTAGDHMLNVIASRLKVAAGADLVFRVDGNEFALIMQDMDRLRDLPAVVAAIMRRVEAPVDYDGHMLLPRAIIGAAVLAPQDISPEVVRRNAEFALHHARKSSHRRHAIYSAALGTRRAQRQASIDDLHAAVEEHRIDAHYQPIVRLFDSEVIGFEALCRLTDRQGRILPARLFQEALSDARVGSLVTDRMLQIVVQDLRNWLDLRLPIQHVGLNVSSADFYLGNLKTRIKSAFTARYAPAIS
jgi:diguanylate cyclase (GGDEF)-like protein